MSALPLGWVDDPSDGPGTGFSEAVRWASRHHRGLVRRDGRSPYLAHLLAVAALVLEDGADRQVAVAALLHDALEKRGPGSPDTPEAAGEILEEIRARFGDPVAAIVQACTDDEAPDGTWAARKQAHLEHLRRFTPAADVLVVIAADKLDNTRALTADLSERGVMAWSTFDATPAEIVGHYAGVAALLADHLPTSRSGRELATVVRRLEADLVALRPEEAFEA